MQDVHKSFIENVSFQNGRYSVSLPFKEYAQDIPENYNLSLVRLNSLVKRLHKEPEVLEQYDKYVQKKIDSGIVEIVDTKQEPELGQVHYLPHHGVIRKTALTTKLHVVFDASSKANSKVPSLNDCIHVGPPLTPAILDILLRFRAKKIGLVADIQEAFLNIAVDERHRDYLQFLWINNIYDEDPDVIILHLAQVAFGVNVSPFLLNDTLQNHIRN